MQIKRFLQLVVAFTAANVFTTGMANAEIELVVVIGKKCGDTTCGSGPFSDQQTDYDPFAMVLTGGGGSTNAEKIQAFFEMLKKMKDTCQQSGESQEAWFLRQLQSWLAERPMDGFRISAVRALLGPEAATGSINPAPPACP